MNNDNKVIKELIEDYKISEYTIRTLVGKHHLVNIDENDNLLIIDLLLLVKELSKYSGNINEWLTVEIRNGITPLIILKDQGVIPTLLLYRAQNEIVTILSRYQV